MIWPNKNNNGRDGGKNSSNNQRSNNNTQWNWTANDKLQVSRAAKSLALALSMDNERVSSQISSEQFQVAMADSLHQVKSPLQALRTFGKLLQRQLAEENNNNNNNNSASGVVAGGVGGPTIRRQRQMLKLAENMAAQGERVVDLIEPMDMLVNTRSNYLLSGDVKQKTTGGLALVRSPAFLLPNGSHYDDDNDDNGEANLLVDDSMKSSPVLGDLQMELAFPNDVLGSCVYAFSMVSREKGINFDAIGFEPDAELPACLISSKQLQEAVSNVIDNAIKYAPMRRKGSRGRPRIPTVKVSLTANEPPLAAGCTLWVEDNGAGIPDDERDSIFERGYRSKEWTDDVDGSGLGLAVARQMITQMGGRIEVVEDGGPSKLQGTTVRIILFRDPETC
jgi:signal transduction histidine kinase